MSGAGNGSGAQAAGPAASTPAKTVEPPRARPDAPRHSHAARRGHAGGGDLPPDERRRNALRSALQLPGGNDLSGLSPLTAWRMPEVFLGAAQQPALTPAALPRAARVMRPASPPSSPAPAKRRGESAPPTVARVRAVHSPAPAAPAMRSSAPPAARGRRVVPAPPIPAAGSGHKLDRAMLARVEDATGAELSDVRVHTDHEAQRRAAEFGARAFTVGKDIFFASGAFAPGTHAGDALIAHELAHVVQDAGAPRPDALMPLSDRADAEERDAVRFARELGAYAGAGAMHPLQPASGPAMVHRDAPSAGEKAAEEKALHDLFGDAGLAALRKEIDANPDAKKLATERGALAYLALANTREGGKLMPAKARAALDADAKKLPGDQEYTAGAITPRASAGRRYWFQDKPPAKGDEELGAVREEEEVFAETVPDNMTQYRVVNVKDVGSVVVRFAFRKREFRGDKRSEDATKSEDLILNAIGKVIADIDNPKSDKGRTKEDRATHEHLRKALQGYTQSHPLNVYLGETTEKEDITGGRLPETDRIYVNPADLGNESKLEAAIRIPLTATVGGDVGLKTLSPLSEGDLKEAVLHESLHAMLISQNASAGQVFESIQPALKITGSPTLQSRAAEVIHRVLLDQEEAFVYGEVAKAGKAYATRAEQGEHFARGAVLANAFLASKGGTLETKEFPLSKVGKGAKAKADWSISYTFTKTATLEPTDLQAINDLLKKFL